MASTVPEPVLGATGYVAPEESDILNAVLADTSVAFGGNLDQGLSTPQGQIASSMTAAIADKNSMFLSLTSQMDPQYAQGRMQDAIGNIYFMNRIPARSTIVQSLCTGSIGASIPANASAKDVAGNIYSCEAGGTIGSDGTVTLPFANVVPGPIPCPASTLNTIYGASNGWDSIANLADGVLGINVESAQAFETRRQLSVAGNSIHSLGAVYAEVASPSSYANPSDTPLDVLVLENFTDSPNSSTGVTISAHSIYVSVIGGTSVEVAAAIWRKNSLGCGTDGNTTVTVTDDTYADPKPEYTVKYQSATGLEIKVSVMAAITSALPSNAVTLIQNAVVAALPLKIGAKVYAGIFYAPIAVAIPGISIYSILVGISSPTDASVTVTPEHYATLTASDVSVGFV